MTEKDAIIYLLRERNDKVRSASSFAAMIIYHKPSEMVPMSDEYQYKFLQQNLSTYRLGMVSIKFRSTDSTSQTI
jgi:hypothetical protein